MLLLRRHRTKKPEGQATYRGHRRPLIFLPFNEKALYPRNIANQRYQNLSTPTANFKWDVDGHGRYYEITDTSGTGPLFKNPASGAQLRTVIIGHKPNSAQADAVIWEQGATGTGERVTLRSFGGFYRVDIEGSGVTSSIAVTPNKYCTTVIRLESTTQIRLIHFEDDVIQRQLLTVGSIATTGDSMGFGYPAVGGHLGVAYDGKFYHAAYFDQYIQDEELYPFLINPWRNVSPLRTKTTAGGGGAGDDYIVSTSIGYVEYIGYPAETAEETIISVKGGQVQFIGMKIGYFIPGQWTDIEKTASSWTDIARSSSTWTDIDKSNNGWTDINA